MYWNSTDPKRLCVTIIAPECHVWLTRKRPDHHRMVLFVSKRTKLPCRCHFARLDWRRAQLLHELVFDALFGQPQLLRYHNADRYHAKTAKVPNRSTVFVRSDCQFGGAAT
jgi:hypothetical protein